MTTTVYQKIKIKVAGELKLSKVIKGKKEFA